MPIYTYICPHCNNSFEELRDMDKRYTALCPECKGESKLTMSLFNFKLYNPFTKDGTGFTSEIAHPDKLKELQAENRRK